MVITYNIIGVIPIQTFVGYVLFVYRHIGTSKFRGEMMQLLKYLKVHKCVYLIHNIEFISIIPNR